VGSGVGVGSGVAVGTGVGVGVGTGVGVAVGMGRGVGVSVGGIAVGNGSVVRLTSEAQADRTNNNTATAKTALIDFIPQVPHPHIEIPAPNEKAGAYRSIPRIPSILHE